MKKLFFFALFFYWLEFPAKTNFIDSLESDLRNAKAAMNYKNLKNLYMQWSLYYEARQDYKNAYIHYKLYQLASDSLLAREQRAIGTLVTLGRSRSNSAILSSEKFQRNSLVVFTITLLVIAFLLLAKLKQNRKNKLLNHLLETQSMHSRSIIESVEKERAQLVHELNEGIGQQISAARLNISALQSFLKTDSASDKLMLQNAVDMLDESVKEVRQVAQKMIPNVLVKAGLVEALRSYTSKLNRENTIIYFESLGNVERSSPVKESVLYRIVIELVDNALLHAQSDFLNIQIIRHEKELCIVVEDNGTGFDAQELLKSDQSKGLRSIQSRVDFLKGTIFFDSRPTKGTTVTLEIPL